MGWGELLETNVERLRSNVIEAARDDIKTGTTGSRERLRRAVEALDIKEGKT